MNTWFDTIVSFPLQAKEVDRNNSQLLVLGSTVEMVVMFNVGISFNNFHGDSASSLPYSL
jgi:hypothetical protein